MDSGEHMWVIVLAAGEGSRLRALTTDDQGVAIPKQFCSLNQMRGHRGESGSSPRFERGSGFAGPSESMLRFAIERAEGIVPKERIITIVAVQHRRWWEKELSDLPPENIVVQPANRGTAVGVLLPLLKIFAQDPHAKILVLPSDHYVEDEEVLRRSIHQILPAAEGQFNRIVLLGIQPDSPDPEYGWIVRGTKLGLVHEVARFVEKPTVPVAEDLMKEGALWNSFMFVAGVSTFMRLFARTLPEILRPLMANHRDLSSIYESLPARDFSRDLLEKTVDRLWVLSVPPCGWSDLGTPKRVASVLNRELEVPSRFISYEARKMGIG